MNLQTFFHSLKQNKNCIDLMVTAFTEYLDDAFKFQAFRYLSKPIDEPRFFRKLNEAMQQYNSLCTTVNIESKNSNHVVPTEDIIMLECVDKQITVHTHSGTYHSFQTTLLSRYFIFVCISFINISFCSINFTGSFLINP